jgi:hypothetical protein
MNEATEAREQKADRLYALLPSVYRKRDADLGQPLRALLRVIAEQVNVVEDDIAQLYENWFIETCEDWVVPYLAELVGYRPVHEGGEPGTPATFEGLARNKILIPRREVANTIRYRRRKGALSVLELLANDVAGWPSRAVEFYQLLSVAQHLNHLHLDRGRTVDLRAGDALDRLNGPFDELAHKVDVRRINSHREQGRCNIPSVGLFVWRLKEYSITKAPAYYLERRHRSRDRNRYTYSVLTNDTQLVTMPFREPEPVHIADEMNVPSPIRRRALDERPADYYGAGKSILIWIDTLDHPVKEKDIIAADLSDWAYSPQGSQVAVDPRLGRIALANDRDATGVWVSYYYAFSADIGGGEYERPLRPPGLTPASKRYRVSQQKGSEPDYFECVNDALLAWLRERTNHPDAIIEIDDSGSYSETIKEVVLQPGERLELRARNGARPLVRLFDINASRGDALVVCGPSDHNYHGRGPQFTLDGLLIAGRGLQFRGGLARVTIRHCTLIPGWSLGHDCAPENEMDASLELIGTPAQVNIEHSILGSILVDQDAVLSDPMRLNITDSILDATRLEYDALSASGPNQAVAHVLLNISRTTVLGAIKTHEIELAENSIFMSHVKVAHSQTGCMRFCYVPAGSRTPPRYECQPDGVKKGVLNEVDKALAELRVRPRFNSVRYGMATYCQLADSCAEEIKRGADDESELGVFHDLFQPQREANLRTRLDEFTPAGINAGIILAN